MPVCSTLRPPTRSARALDGSGARIRSIANEEFELFAQPIIDFEGRERPMYEVFLRMRASDGSLIAPGAFLPVAERHDLIQSIDAWVFSRR